MQGSLVLLTLFACSGWGEPPCRHFNTAFAVLALQSPASHLARFQAKDPPAPPVKLQAGKTILQEGERLILPRGTAVGKEQWKGTAAIAVTSFKWIPAKKDQWEYEVRPLGSDTLKINPAAGALDGVRVQFAGFRGELLDDTTLAGVFTWIDQPHEIRDRAGRVLFRTKARE